MDLDCPTTPIGTSLGPYRSRVFLMHHLLGYLQPFSAASSILAEVFSFRLFWPFVEFVGLLVGFVVLGLPVLFSTVTNTLVSVVPSIVSSHTALYSRHEAFGGL